MSRRGIQGNIATAIALGTTEGAGGSLSLPLLAWEGGPDYWTVAQSGEAMTKAEAAGWSDPSFFPIAIFLGKPESGHPAALAALGINVYMAAEYNPPVTGHLTNLSNAGIYSMLNPDNPYTTPAEVGWDSADVGSDPNVVGWFLCDEPDMGYGGYIGTEDQFGFLAAVEALAATATALDDGRFLWTNFGNGILRTFWSPDTMDNMMQEVHGYSVDKYPYTSPVVRFEYGRSDDWLDDGGTESNAESSSPYGWNMLRLRTYWEGLSGSAKPKWGFVETKMPFLDESGRGIITYAEIEGAVWSAIANEARGMAYFQHNGDYGPAGGPAIDPNTGIAPTTETYSLVEGQQALKDAVALINTRLAELAPVINTQSFVWDFGATGIDTMLKGTGGYAYIFASVGIAASVGSKTFTLTGTGITGTTVEVLYESRTVNVSGGQFSDSFANEYSHHIYKVLI